MKALVQFKKYIDEIYTCVTLFNILLFIIIKYDNKYLDYSKGGWPEKKFNLNSL